MVSNFGIHHVPRPVFALREAHRVLRAGGRVAFSFWAEPGENIAWKLVFDAIARHGDRAAARTPAPGGGFGTAAQCADALREVGFADCTTRLVYATWQHRDAQALVTARQGGNRSDGGDARFAAAGRNDRHHRRYRGERRELSRRRRHCGTDRRGDRVRGQDLKEASLDIYHAWCDLKPGVSDTTFADNVAAYMGQLKEQGLIESWRLTRRKLGFGVPGAGRLPT